MADALTIEFSDEVTPFLNALDSRVAEAIQKTVDETAEVFLRAVEDATPRDSGDAAAGWKTRDGEGLSREVYNDVPYINMLEYGGYPVVPKSRKRPGAHSAGLQRGNAVLGGYKAGPRTTKKGGGTPEMRSNVSRQATKGMVRDQMEKIRPLFRFNLGEALDRALSGE